MKLLYVINRMTNLAGIERILSCKMNFLAENTFYQIILTTYEQDGRPLSFQHNKKISYIPIQAPIPIREHRSFLKWLIGYHKARKAFKREFYSLLKELKPDIVISTVYSYQYLDIICHATYEQNIKTIIESHTKGETILIARKFAYNKLLYHLFSIWDKHILSSIKHCQCVVTLTKYDLPFWQQHVRHTEVIPNMLTISPLKVKNYHVKRAISAGRYMTEKGVDRILEAWHLLSEEYKEWELFIFGDEDRLPYQAIIDQYKMNNRVHLMPATNNIAEEFSKSSIYLMGSRYEGFGLVLAEAMSCGLPCISFDCPYGPREIIRDGKDGFLVNDGDIEAYAHAMECLMSDESLRRTMGETAIQNIARFEPESIMNNWKSLFEKI